MSDYDYVQKGALKLKKTGLSTESSAKKYVVPASTPGCISLLTAVMWHVC